MVIFVTKIPLIEQRLYFIDRLGGVDAGVDGEHAGTPDRDTA
jgi:hypothetical protein